MPSSLNCPTCGAPAPSADAARCAYCGSALTRAACPSCFGPVFVGMEFCPHCGAKGSRTTDDAAASIPCPGCNAEMRPIRVGSTPMHECTACSSAWLDTETFTQLCVNRDERGVVASTIGSTKGPAVRSVAAAVRYVSCPVCKKIMNRQNFGRSSGVVIDVCKGHGVWFEHRELQGVLVFIENGGFSRARDADEKRRDEERHKLEREFLESARSIPHTYADPRRRAPDNESLLDEALRLLLS